MPLISRTSAEIYYEASQGEGDWITLINGHTRTLRDFSLLAKRLHSAGFSVLRFDSRGAGKTVYKGQFDLIDIAEDIAFLWKQLKIEHSSLLGISMGGWIAQITATSWPSHINKVFLISTSASKPTNTQLEQPWGTTLEDITAKLTNYFSDNFAQKNQLLIKSMAKQILQQINLGVFSDQTNAQRRAISCLNLDKVTQKIERPTIIIHGAEDNIIPFEYAKELHNKIRESQLIKIENAGHLLLAEAPKNLFNHIYDFLKD